MHSLALRTNGQVAAWGRNDEGQTNVPLDLNGVIAIAAGNTHSLAIKSNGTVAAWGDNSSGQCDVPAGLTNVTAVTAGFNHSVALKSDGTVVAWGDNTYGQLEVPVGLSNIIAIAAGDSHTLAVKADGSGVGWGWDGDGETDFPAGATNLVAVAGGYSHSMALREDGTVVCWGWNPEGEATVPSGLGNVAAISAGTSYSMALLNANWPVILKQPANVSLENGGTLLLKVSAVGAPTLRFQWQRNGVDLADGAGVSGSRTSTLTIVGVQPGKAGSYSVTVTNPAGAVTSRPATVSVLLAPSVRIRAQGNVLSLSWPAQPAGFVLEHSATLSPPQWVAVTNTTGSLGNETTCSIPMSATKDFYRLRFDGP